MPNTKFNAKSFNPEAFGKYMEAVPNTKLNKLRESRAIVSNPKVRELFGNQTGTAYGRIPFFAAIGNDEPLNYDGQTDITAVSSETFEQGVFTFGRAQGWTEDDFTYDITGGVDFMANIRSQIIDYWNACDQDTQLSILAGLFAVTGEENKKFVDTHTMNITGETGDAALVGPTTLNNTIQLASGDHKNQFTMVLCHSQISTNLENMKLLTYLKYTDVQGMERDLGLGTWNGRLVIIDDSMPTKFVPAVTTSGKEAPAYTEYTTYVLGEGAISWDELGAKVPYEMVRDAKTRGGVDTLINRRRIGVSVYGFSYEKKAQASLSPTNAEMANGANWTLINNGESGAKAKYFDHKAIKIARIISKG